MESIANYESDDDTKQEIDAVIVCDICNTHLRKYKCPRCEINTCSLKCCKQHKLENFCNGRRDRTKFVPHRQFAASTLRNDFHFLEDVLQSKDCARRNANNNFGGTKVPTTMAAPALLHSKPIQKLDLCSRGTKKLVMAARTRDMCLLIMPGGMSKRKNNTTQYLAKTDEILWRIQLVFIVGDCMDMSKLFDPNLDTNSEMTVIDSLISITVPAVSEGITLEALLSRYLDPLPGNSVQRHALRELRLRRPQLTCFLHKLPSPANKPCFIEIPLGWSVKDALRGRTIVEYPCLYFGVREDLEHVPRLIATITISNNDQNIDENKEDSNSVELEVLSSIETGDRSSSSCTTSATSSSVLKRILLNDDSCKTSDSKRTCEQLRASKSRRLPRPHHVNNHHSIKEEDNDEDIDHVLLRAAQDIAMEEGQVFDATAAEVTETEMAEPEPEVEMEDDRDEFFAALAEFEHTDISTLSAFIQSYESELVDAAT